MIRLGFSDDLPLFSGELAARQTKAPPGVVANGGDCRGTAGVASLTGPNG